MYKLHLISLDTAITLVFIIIKQGPANESYSDVDYGLESIKCQTAPEHSGQKSDAACSAEKASVNLDIKSNRGSCSFNS